MGIRRVTRLLIGVVVLLAISPTKSARFAVGEDGRNDNDFSKSESLKGRWAVENGTQDGPAPYEKFNSDSRADGREAGGTKQADDTETLEKMESVDEADFENSLEDVDGEVFSDVVEEEADDMTHGAEEEEGSDASDGREKRALDTPIYQASSYAKSIVGKTFNFNNLTNLTNNVRLTFSGKSINLTQFRIEQTDVVKLDNFLRGQSLPYRLYVVASLAGIEQAIAKGLNISLTSLAIENLVDDTALTRKDVDELKHSIKEDPSVLTLNAQVKLTNQTKPVILTRKKRKATSLNDRKWPTTIRYVITSDFLFLPSHRAAIDAAIRHWEKETCLNFVRVSGDTGSHLRFRRLSGCWSYVGRIGGGQTISVGYGCNSKGIVAHEIGHALGFWHEQSRPDRSNYVNIHVANISPGRLHNFVRKGWSDVLTLGIPYDYSSLMHYGTHYFSKNGKKTISAKEADMDQTLGSRFGLSFYDVKLANYRYCSGKCSGGLTRTICKNGGYRDPKNCNKCKCPDGWTGMYCTIVDYPVKATCGSKYLTATSVWKTLSSPNYETSGLPSNSQCTWRIRAVGAYRQVVMQFWGIFKVQSSCPRTCSNYVEVRHQDLARTGPRYCCSRPTKFFRAHRTTGSVNDMLLLMRIGSASGLKGFKLRYRYENCGGYGSTARYHPACVDSQPYTCYWGSGRFRRTSTCYRQVKRCYSGYRLIGNNCWRIWSSWSPWSSWSSCSRSCGGCGYRSRSRSCQRAPCSGNSRQTEACNKQICPPTTKLCRESYRCGSWWSRRTCYRYKTCTEPSKCCPGRRLVGGECLQGIWSSWSSWSSCSRSCGGCGYHSRSRSCQRAPCRSDINIFRNNLKTGFWSRKLDNRIPACITIPNILKIAPASSSPRELAAATADAEVAIAVRQKHVTHKSVPQPPSFAVRAIVVDRGGPGGLATGTRFAQNLQSVDLDDGGLVTSVCSW